MKLRPDFLTELLTNDQDLFPEDLSNRPDVNLNRFVVGVLRDRLGIDNGSNSASSSPLSPTVFLSRFDEFPLRIDLLDGFVQILSDCVPVSYEGDSVRIGRPVVLTQRITKSMIRAMPSAKEGLAKRTSE